MSSSNKKMKGVALNPSSYGGFGDSKARIKHQTLLQDYQDLQKETEGMRTKLVTMKQRKLTLLAEVRFLRQRKKFLLKNKAAKPSQGREVVQPKIFGTQFKKTPKEKTSSRKQAKLRNVSTGFDVNQRERISARRYPGPVVDVNQKNRIHNGKEATLRNTTQVFDLNQKQRSYGGKEASFRNPFPILDLNQNERLYSGKETGPRNSALAFDLNQMERTCVGKDDVVRSRAPIFDLNQISGEEELQDNSEPLRNEESKKFVMRGGSDEQHNDLKLSVCRNVGSGPNRAGKRKISWQDQVALKV